MTAERPLCRFDCLYAASLGTRVGELKFRVFESLGVRVGSLRKVRMCKFEQDAELLPIRSAGGADVLDCGVLAKCGPQRLGRFSYAQLGG